MAANKKLWWIALYFCSNGLVVLPGITADVGNPNINAFTPKAVVQRKFHSGFVIVYIPINSTQSFEGFDGIGHLQIAYIAGMPDFVG